jgi:hypothetical protein
MSKKPAFPIGRPRSSTRPDLTARVETVRHLNEINRRRTIPVQAIAETLVAEGYTSLDKQAKALGLPLSYLLDDRLVRMDEGNRAFNGLPRPKLRNTMAAI